MLKDPNIYHITHLDNLAGILQEGGLWCDRERAKRNFDHTNIGHQHIKARRSRRAVTVAAMGTLGDYVPFYFCNRSIMLCAIHHGHQNYAGGQAKILHLVSTVHRAVEQGRPWAFTDRHAELAHAQQYDRLASLNEVRWDVMDLKYWTEVKEERQAEFLVHEFFPWKAVTEVAVMTDELKLAVEQALQDHQHKPLVSVRRNWYY